MWCITIGRNHRKKEQRPNWLMSKGYLWHPGYVWLWSLEVGFDQKHQYWICIFFIFLCHRYLAGLGLAIHWLAMCSALPWLTNQHFEWPWLMKLKIAVLSLVLFIETMNYEAIECTRRDHFITPCVICTHMYHVP